MDKLDLVKTNPDYYNPPKRPVEATFGPIPYLAISGRGEPGGVVHSAATEAQFTVAYTAKFAAKAQGRDFTVAKQEGLWWFDKGETRAAVDVPRETWNWTLLIRVPDFLDEAAIADAITVARTKKPDLDALNEVRFQVLTEGRCVQMMHLGPFTTEPQTVALIKDYMAAHGLEHNGHHHEIYLSDIRRLPAEKWRTVLRFPVRARG